MILFYTPGTCALAEIIVLQWTGEPHRLCRLSREERQGPVYRSTVNPMGQVPALLIDGRVLTENTALLALLADRRPERGLLPVVYTPERYEAHRRLAWFDSTFHVAHKPLFAPQRFHPDPALHDAIRAQALVQIRGALSHLDAGLRRSSWVMGPHRSVVDAYAFALSRWCESRIDYAAEFPNVKRFLDMMRAEPGVARALQIETTEPGPDHLSFAALTAGNVLRGELDA